MKILHTVEFYHPSIGGMQEVVKQISERLVELGHDVTVATTRLESRCHCNINGVKVVEFDISGNFVRGMSGNVKEYQEYLLNNDFDIITNFAAQQWGTDAMLQIIDQVKCRKVFVPTGFSGLYLDMYKDYFNQMKTWLLRYDMNIFLSDDYRDINFARKCGVQNISLIPNGASEKEFSKDSHADIRAKYDIPSSDFLILHVGSHTGIKGHKEIIKIVNKAKIKNATVLIVANKVGIGCSYSCKLSQLVWKANVRHWLDNKKLIIKNLSREDTVAAYKQADLFLFPSNVECSPIVLFECMASKTPFLSSDVGNAKEIATWSKSGTILPTLVTKGGLSKVNIEGSIKILENLYSDRVSLSKMANSGYQAWLEKFTWEKIAQEYEKLYIQLLFKREPL
ncbi:glycosyl transferase [Sporomusaceae bacterium FL31]|nr:glycosyl transferase [Sporomusaceae bacterium FL31]GCE33898.1 glycosyl transferase [Sporomusaceae bacterium]